ncbi:unnamed protein product [Clonostachys rosea f. rosea IK726]|uniref:DUF7703 domain-containing protein n=2 Tax=Bionectria ochroleuca TaxID=29856 RepID=A0A0B7KB43_BIOOC|nr:unnamed protein product [Clonostachys rosea f. rosea IK726]
MAGEDSGIAREHAVTGPNSYVILVFACIAIYNVIELTFVIWGSFKRHSGMYFWTFIVSTYGIFFYSIGFILKSFMPEKVTYVYVTFIGAGWVAMVTGQSLVLWSRLHLIVRSNFRLKMVLGMIIVDAIILHVPILVMLYGANGPDPDKWVGPYGIYEKVQVTVFFIQELILSSFYIVETVRLSRLQVVMRNKKRSRNLMYHLIVVNVVIILLDITILGLEYSNMYDIQTSYKALVYSVKLKMEFNILNKLVEMTTGNRDHSSSGDQNKSSAYGGRTAITNAGIELETTKNGGVPRNANVSYQAYAHKGDERADTSGRSAEGSTSNGVIMTTTEIVVKSEQRESDSEVESFQEAAITGGPRHRTTREDRVDLPKSSSEIHLASRGA